MLNPLSRIVQCLTQPRRPRTIVKRAKGARLAVETLEDRVVPSITAVDDFYVVPSSGPYHGSSVLANDINTTGQVVYAGLMVVPSHGAVVVDLDGTFVYTPTLGYTGTDLFRYYSWTAPVPGGSAADVHLFVGDVLPPATNHAPTSSDNSVSTLEDTPYVFSAGDFAFSDPNDAMPNSFQAVKFYTLPNGGTLTDNGSPVVPSTPISVSDIIAGRLIYTPAQDANGVNYDSCKFAVQDNGGWNDTSGAYTMNFDVTAVNDAPDFVATDPPPTAAEAGPVAIPAWATFKPGGGADEASETPTYYVTNVSNPSLFAALPTIDSNGKLRYTPAPAANGESTFDLQVQDSDGTANGGVDLSPVQQFRIQMNALAPPGFDRLVAPVVVNTTEDTQDSDLTDGVPLDQTGATSLRSVIEQFNAAPASSTITVRFDLPPNSTINLGIPLPALNTSFDISGPGYNQLTIQRGANAGNFRIFTVSAGKSVRISNLTIAKGNAAGMGDAGNGGAIFNAGTLTVYGAIIRENVANERGGAISNSRDGVLIVDNCYLYQNQAGISGGAILNYGQAAVLGATQIFLNRASTGGGISNLLGGLLIQGGTQIRSNTATGSGGGVFNSGNLVMADSFLETNYATDYGGGLLNQGGAAYLSSVSIQGNEANGPNGKGGGLYVYGGSVTVAGCIIRNNRSTVALYNGAAWRRGFGTFTQINCNTNGNFTED